MFKRLLWKEWQENLWKLGFGLCTSWAFTLLLLRIRIIPDNAACAVISLGQLLVIPVVYTLDLFSGEVSSRTIHLLFKLPVPRWKIFAGKILVALGSMALIFLSTGVLMELLAHGREAPFGMLFRMNAWFGLCAVVLVAWFSVFGCQTRSEAASLVALFSVASGWAVVLLWSGLCGVFWALHLVPYTLLAWAVDRDPGRMSGVGLLTTQVLMVIGALVVAGYRYVKIRRIL